jgi:methylated-DNA-[protein]-cysteine S-methyltransferase
MTASAEGNALTGLWFTGQKHYPPGTEKWTPRGEYPVFRELRRWLKDYFARRNPRLSFPLDPGGTEFQKSLWEILLTIPYGQQTTYGEIAEKMTPGRGRSSVSARAVGVGVGRNPISIVIPCHRVVGSGGNLTGYAGGLDRKKALLQLEEPGT